MSTDIVGFETPRYTSLEGDVHMTRLTKGNGITSIQVPFIFKYNGIETQRVNVAFVNRVQEYNHVGDDTLGFHKKRRRASSPSLAPINRFKQWTRDGICSGGVWSVASDGLSTVETDCLPVFGENVWVDKGALEAAAERTDFSPLIQKAAAKIAPEFDALTFGATYKQTLELFERATYKTAAFAADPRNWRRDPKKSFGAAAQGWLIYRYGLTPALMDLNAIVEILHGHKGTQSLLAKAIASATETVQSHHTSFYTDAAVKLTLHRTDSMVVTSRALVTAMLKAQKSAAKLNPLATVWELIPYSFVVDWFVNVGNAIDTMSVVLNSSDANASLGTYTVGSSSAYVQVEAQNGFRRSDWLQASANATLTTRLPGTLSYTPTWKPALNWKRGIDATALLWGAYNQMMKKRK